MNLKQVTITSADDSIDPRALVALSSEFPFAEWGILLSLSNCGSNRYPTKRWLHTLTAVHEVNKIKLSLHIQGHYLRELFYAESPEVVHLGLWSHFQRVQLNFHGVPINIQEYAIDFFIQKLSEFGEGKQFIFQMDGVNDEFYRTLFRLKDWRTAPTLDTAPLFDLSGGAGVLPSSWPHAGMLNLRPGTLADWRGTAAKIAHGYAGGLGPDNLAEQIPLIAQAADGAEFWIDMETQVRSESDRMFDLTKVRRCLEIAAPFVSA